jgi:hypothetical protein
VILPLLKRWNTHSSQSHFSTVVMKNWEPLVLGPEFALDNSPASKVVAISQRSMSRPGQSIMIPTVVLLLEFLIVKLHIDPMSVM